MKVTAPAKLNLFLNIVGKRQDGYHCLESLFAPIKLADIVTLERSNDLEVDVPGVGPINTVRKVVDLIYKCYRPKGGVKVSVEKNIPIGAGLGGSSANAGALIPALCKFWDIEVTVGELKEIALQIGADAPYFLDPKPSYVTGIGEEIKPINLGVGLHMLVVYPGFEILTKEVYKNFSSSFSTSILGNDKQLIDSIYSGKNDLEDAAIQLRPEVGFLLKEIKQQDGCKIVRMSGSGSACFGVFTNEAKALEAKEAFAERYFAHYEYMKV
jgi:4-diphosphocytidyl-2-C-methyl-D-erythritol kinase